MYIDVIDHLLRNENYQIINVIFKSQKYFLIELYNSFMGTMRIETYYNGKSIDDAKAFDKKYAQYLEYISKYLKEE